MFIPFTNTNPNRGDCGVWSVHTVQSTKSGGTHLCAFITVRPQEAYPVWHVPQDTWCTGAIPDRCHCTSRDDVLYITGQCPNEHYFTLESESSFSHILSRFGPAIHLKRFRCHTPICMQDACDNSHVSFIEQHFIFSVAILNCHGMSINIQVNCNVYALDFCHNNQICSLCMPSQCVFLNLSYTAYNNH